MNMNIIDLIITILAVIIMALYLYTYYIETVKNHSLSFPALTVNERLLKLSLSSAGAVVPYGGQTPNNNAPIDGETTVVELTDADLNELLEVVFDEIGDTDLISIELLQSLGLYTDSVVTFLTSLGYFLY